LPLASRKKTASYAGKYSGQSIGPSIACAPASRTAAAAASSCAYVLAKKAMHVAVGACLESSKSAMTSAGIVSRLR
jgi:hypothetical protein